MAWYDKSEKEEDVSTGGERIKHLFLHESFGEDDPKVITQTTLREGEFSVKNGEIIHNSEAIIGLAHSYKNGGPLLTSDYENRRMRLNELERL